MLVTGDALHFFEVASAVKTELVVHLNLVGLIQVIEVEILSVEALIRVGFVRPPPLEAVDRLLLLFDLHQSGYDVVD